MLRRDSIKTVRRWLTALNSDLSKKLLKKIDLFTYYIIKSFAL